MQAQGQLISLGLSMAIAGQYSTVDLENIIIFSGHCSWRARSVQSSRVEAVRVGACEYLLLSRRGSVGVIDSCFSSFTWFSRRGTTGGVPCCQHSSDCFYRFGHSFTYCCNYYYYYCFVGVVVCMCVVQLYRLVLCDTQCRGSQ